jgi:hypothetical protein
VSRTVLYQCPECPRCGVAEEMELDEAALLAWQRDTLIQEAFPDLTRDQCETIKLGYHPRCWDLDMGPEE